MVDIYSVTLEDNSTHIFVDEEDYFCLLLSIKSLVEQQRIALHSHDKDMIIACKKREDSLLKYFSDYEVRRKLGL